MSSCNTVLENPLKYPLLEDIAKVKMAGNQKLNSEEFHYILFKIIYSSTKL